MTTPAITFFESDQQLAGERHDHRLLVATAIAFDAILEPTW